MSHDHKLEKSPERVICNISKKMPIFRCIFVLLLALAQVRSDKDCEKHSKALKETKHNLTICNEKLLRLKDEQNDLFLLTAIKNGKH